MKKRIFVIDDEKDIRDILKVNLLQEGYEVFQFSSAAEATKGFETVKPDLIILDIMMEGKDGYEFCRDLRGSDKLKNKYKLFVNVLILLKIYGLEIIFTIVNS